MIFRLARADECEKVLELYQEARENPFCVWNENYPTMLEIEHDFETENLYVLTENDTVIGALSIVPENEMDDFPAWKVTENVRELARVVIAKAYQGHGYAALMVQEILGELKENIYFAVHLSVVESNLPALKTYLKCGFTIVGEADMYGHHYFLLEKAL